MTLRRVALVAAPFLVVPVLTGCPNQNLYATPRTVPAGKVNIQASAEGVGLSAKTACVNGTGGASSCTDSIYLPTLPSVGVRVGVADGVDLGARLSNLSSLQIDGKFNFIRSNTFDMAVDPGIQAAYLGSVTSGSGSGSTSLGLFYFNIPLVLGINFTHALTLVLTPGATVVLATDSVNSGSGTSEFATGTAPFFRMGLGLNIRATDTVSIQPEFTLLRAFNSDEATLMNFGVGGNFGIGKGSGPDYSTVH
jgi:hypothetical protein